MVDEAEETRLPSWYAVPTTKVRNDPGLSSIKWIGITPHAPWTQNCSKKAAAMMAFEEVKVYGYNRAPPMTDMTMMVKRRPKIWEQYPIVVPPVRAPRLATTWVTVTALAEKLYWLERSVG